MKRVNRLLEHPVYKAALKSIEEAEEKRIFCRHDMEHFLSVARVAHIYNLQEGAGLDQELIYAAALLHDIGRAAEYEDGTPHQEAGAQLSKQLLSECGFDEEAQHLILPAIRFHRQNVAEAAEKKGGQADKTRQTAAEREQEQKAGQSTEKSKYLREYLYRADKKSRLCFSCKAQKECNWGMEKRNLEIQY